MNVTKCNQNNAIKVAAFAIEFDSPASLSEFKAFYEYWKVKGEAFFHRANYLEGFSVQFSRDGNFTDSGSNILGVSLTGPDSWEFIFRDHLVVFQTTKYINWEESVRYAKASLEFFADFLASHKINKKIQLIGLDFLDEFLIQDEHSEWISDLFSKESKYLPNFIFEQRGFWHTNIGFFKDNVLNIANLDYSVMENGQHIQRISALHRTREISYEFPSDITPKIFDNLNKMHDLNVELIKDVLTKEVLNDIGFKEDVCQ